MDVIRVASLVILFIGNSLTYENDLPSMVRRIGEVAGRKVSVKMIAKPNYALEDHLAPGESRRALTEGRWDIAVLQQGPSSLDESRRQFIHDATGIRRIVPKGKQLAILTVWPDRSRFAYFDAVIESHELAAEAAGARVIPAGNALRTLVGEDFPLLAGDGFHPTPEGTFLAALITYRTLVGPLPPNIATRKVAEKIAGQRLDVSDEQLKRMCSVAP